MKLRALERLWNTPAANLLEGLFLFRGYNPFSPHFILLLLTYKCTLNCDFCYQDRRKRDTFPDMNLNDARLIETNIRDSFMIKPRIHLSGGELTVNDDFIKILNLFSEKSYKISLTTNGINIDKYIGDLFNAQGLTEIIISLNNPDFFERLRITLEFFKSLSKERKIFLNLNCPINASNQSDLVNIVEKFEDSCAYVLSFQHTIFSGQNNNKIDHNVVAEQIRLIENRKNKIPVLFLPSIKLKDIKNYYSHSEAPFNINRCLFPWFVLNIEPDGNIICCPGTEFIVGNVKKNSLKEVWNNAGFRDFRRKTKINIQSYPGCNRCCHRQYY